MRKRKYSLDIELVKKIIDTSQKENGALAKQAESDAIKAALREMEIKELTTISIKEKGYEELTEKMYKRAEVILGRKIKRTDRRN